jgi:hypothetical protein
MELADCITILYEQAYQSTWVKVFVPYHLQQAGAATLLSRQGAILKKLSLHKGYNAIDISNYSGQSISIKVETAFETILKEIQNLPS